MTSTEMPDVGAPTRRPLRADAERNRQRLLAAARDVFAERGLDATLDEVAARAGVGVGTAYRRFANKEELIDAIFQLRIDGIVTLAHECAAMPDVGEGLVRFLQETCAAIAADRGIRDLLLHGSHGPARVASPRARLVPATSVLIARAQEAGAIRPDFTVTDLPIVILMLEAVTSATERLDPGLWRRYLALVLDGLRADPGRAGPLPGRPLTPDKVEAAMTDGRRSPRAPGD